MDEEIAVFCGLDVGKSEHHATALDRSGERIFDKPLPQDEARLRELFTGLQEHGRVLVIVDQPNTIGALPVAVARDCGAAVAYLPGLAMRKAADMYPGNFLVRRRCPGRVHHRGHGPVNAPHPAVRGPGQRSACGPESALRVRR